jgi:PPE-repeat protein
VTTFGDSAANPPEVNYYTLTAGDQAVSMTTAATAYQALADALTAEMAAMGANVAGTTAEGWIGLGGAAMTATGAEYLSVLGLAVAWLNEAAAAAAEVAAAYHTAQTSMTPGEVCDTNRVTEAGLQATNFLGVNTVPIAVLDESYFGQFWPQNAALMASYQAVVSAALGVLSTPPPVAPPTGNPAVAASSAAQIGAQSGIDALQASGQSLSQAASAAPAGAQGATAPAGGTLDVAQQLLGTVSQTGSQLLGSAGQLPQSVGQFPQMLSQGLGQFTGLLGPMTNASGVPEAALAAEVAPVGAAGLSGGASGGGAALNAAGFGGAGGIVPSAYTKPVSSFAAPAQPKLPGAWSAGAPPEPVPAPGPAGGPGGGGGLYGAPGSLARGDAAAGAEKAPARSRQLVSGTTNRGNGHHI